MTDRNDAQRQAVVVPRQNGRFADKVAFITGATSGIGRATALAFAWEGASVVVAEVAADGNRKTARQAKAAARQSVRPTEVAVPRGTKSECPLGGASGVVRRPEPADRAPQVRRS